MKEKEVQSWVEKILDSMLIEGAGVEVIPDEGGGLFVDVQVDEESSGMLIGYRGEGLVALQRLIRIIFGRNEEGEDRRVLLNINDYRASREEKLRQTVARAADRVLSQGGIYQIRGLSSAERFIVHEEVSSNPEYVELTSYSQGEEPNRVLVVAFKE